MAFDFHLDEFYPTIQTIFPFVYYLSKESIIYGLIACLLFWVLLEIFFWLIVDYFVAPRLQKFKNPAPIKKDVVQFFEKILCIVDKLDSYDIKTYFSGFFHFCQFDDIQFDNLCSFFAWAAFGKHLKDLHRDESCLIYDLTEKIVNRYDELKSVKRGYNPNLKHCSFTLEPVPYIHRPLFIYVFNGLWELIFNFFFLQFNGFQNFDLEGVNYWFKSGPNNGLPPVVIFHGISPGWSLYFSLISYFGTNRTVLLIDFDAIKIKSMSFYMPTTDQFCNIIIKIFRKHHIDKVSLVGHSFGTIICGWLIMRHPDYIHHMTLIDPVSLLLALPDVAYSFLYRKPTKLTEWIIHLTAARELTISHTLHRNFVWHENALWLEDIPNHIGIVLGLGTDDEINNMKAVAEYGQHCHEVRMERKQKSEFPDKVADIKCVEWKNYSHGQILISFKALSAFYHLVLQNEGCEFKSKKID